MRAVFLLLLFVNAAFLAWTYYARSIGSQGERMAAQQLEPEKVRLVSRDEATRLARERLPGCAEWGPISPADIARAQDALNGILPGAKVEQVPRSEASGWWVYVPPLASRQAANQRVAELRRSGITDLFVIPDDAKLRNGISLGVFRSEEAAKGYVEALRKRGVRDVVLAERERNARVYLQVQNVPPPLRKRMAELKTAFLGSEVQDCQAETAR
jgi:SPOR domain